MKKIAILLAIGIGIFSSVVSQVRVTDNGRFLQTNDGKPFFWLGDTDWELFHRLSREEAADFINIRSRQGFNVLQAVALAEFNGIREPNYYGDYPLNNEDPTNLLTTPGNDPKDAYQYDYWDHVDYIIGLAAAKHMYIGLLPTWGDKVTKMWGEGPVVFNEQNARAYGRLLATRYAKQWNILWILGGDRPATYDRDGRKTDDRAIWRAMAGGIQEVLGADAFITYHPSGGETRTSSYIQEEPWLDMNAFQSGHGSRESDPWRWVEEDLAKIPTKPTLDMEPCYEDHPVNPWDGKWTRERGYFTAYDVRARIYRGVFAGACGVTYGHHQVWQFMDTTRHPAVNPGDTIIPWRVAAESEAASELQFLRNLILSRPYSDRRSANEIIRSARGTDYRDLLYATKDVAGSYALVYLPQARPVTIDLSYVSGTSKIAWWFNPRTGKASVARRLRGSRLTTFTPTSAGDWVLVIDDASKNFAPPGAVQ